MAERKEYKTLQEAYAAVKAARKAREQSTNKETAEAYQHAVADELVPALNAALVLAEKGDLDGPGIERVAEVVLDLVT